MWNSGFRVCLICWRISSLTSNEEQAEEAIIRNEFREDDKDNWVAVEDFAFYWMNVEVIRGLLKEEWPDLTYTVQRTPGCHVDVGSSETTEKAIAIAHMINFDSNGWWQLIKF